MKDKVEEFYLNDQIMHEINKQFQIWSLFLNHGIGILAFTFGLACLGTKSPSINATLCLFILLVIRHQGRGPFPRIVSNLRVSAKESDIAFIVLKGIEAHKMNIRVIIKEYTLFLVGFIFLLTVMFLPLLKTIFPLLSAYY